jgi:hypothetical protein
VEGDVLVVVVVVVALNDGGVVHAAISVHELDQS